MPKTNTSLSVPAGDIYPLVLLGGGHSHAQWIKQWRQYWQKLPQTHVLKSIRPLLISQRPASPYSGMLPGLLTGQYDYDDCHIDLVNLCQKSGCDFKQATCFNIQQVKTGNPLATQPLYRLDLNNEDGQPESIYCTTLSINIGSQPFIPVATETPTSLRPAEPKSVQWRVKPISQFYSQWQKLQERLTTHNEEKIVVSIIGAGAAGVEIACAIKVAQQNYHVQIESHSALPLPNFKIGLQKRCLQRLQQMGVEFIHHPKDSAHTSTADVKIICTQSAAPSWLRATDLSLSEQGFINVDSHLQTPLKGIFGAGDCIHFNPKPLAKSGVYAVRQANTLFHNTCASITQSKLKVFKPQTTFLSIINMGHQYALAQRGCLSMDGYWLWRYKHYLDSQFMAQFKVEP